MVNEEAWRLQMTFEWKFILRTPYKEQVKGCRDLAERKNCGFDYLKILNSAARVIYVIQNVIQNYEMSLK